MSLDDIVQVDITVESASVTQAGFGTPMILAYHTHNTDRVRTYTSAAAVLADSFTVSDPAYQMALAIFSQNPKVPRVKIGRRDNVTTWRMELTPTVANNAVYSGKFQLPGGTEESFSYTSDGTATLAEITAGLVAAINALTGAFTATDQTSHVRVVSDVAGVVFSLHTVSSNISVKNNTPNVSIATDLATVQAADDDWYCLLTASKGEAEILALAAAVEATRKLFIVASQNTAIKTSSALDIASQLQTANYARTALLFHDDEAEQADAAWAGKVLPYDPGSETWKFKTLAGIPTVTLTDSELNFIKGKDANFYILLAGVAITGEGMVSDGEFIDVVRFVDFIHARMQEGVFAVLAAAVKIPYTDQGVAIIENEVRRVLRLGVNQGGFTNDPVPTVSVPKVADVAPADKTARLLPDVTFTATLAGAIHAVQITGTVSV